jgi:hypothetical protein
MRGSNADDHLPELQRRLSILPRCGAPITLRAHTPHGERQRRLHAAPGRSVELP